MNLLPIISFQLSTNHTCCPSITHEQDKVIHSFLDIHQISFIPQHNYSHWFLYTTIDSRSGVCQNDNLIFPIYTNSACTNVSIYLHNWFQMELHVISFITHPLTTQWPLTQLRVKSHAYPNGLGFWEIVHWNASGFSP